MNIRRVDNCTDLFNFDDEVNVLSVMYSYITCCQYNSLLLIGAKYRQTFSLSEDLGGGINQILKQRTELARNYNSLFVKSQKDGEPFNANNVECILIIGNVSLLSADEKEAFDTFRNDLRSVHIIGFDELLGKISILLNLFESDV